MRIGILGSGLIGGKLGTIFARAGHDVVFSYSRGRGMVWGEEYSALGLPDAEGNAAVGKESH